MNLYFYNGFQCSFEEIIAPSQKTKSAMVTDYIAQTVQFCQEWLHGKANFTIHTSGSTGAPKPIQISRQQMEASAKATAQALDLQKGHTALVCINTNYIGGKMMLVRGLQIGMDMVIVEPSAYPLANFIKFPTRNIDFCAFVPLQLLAILKSEEREENQQQLNEMRAIIVGGAPVSAELEYLLQSVQTPVYNTYGMTETVSHIALKRLNGKEKSPYYQVLPQTEIGTDARNCLTITAPVTNFETIITNDKVRLIDDKHFEWLGRVDNVINSGGIKIQIEKVENEIDKILTEHHLFCRFVIIGLSDAKLGEMLVLVLEDIGKKTKDIDNAEQDRILKLLKQKLNKYEVPRKIISLPQFPQTVSGKIDRLKIKEESLSII